MSCVFPAYDTRTHSSLFLLLVFLILTLSLTLVLIQIPFLPLPSTVSSLFYLSLIPSNLHWTFVSLLSPGSTIDMSEA